jgi:hypothetical protein
MRVWIPLGLLPLLLGACSVGGTRPSLDRVDRSAIEPAAGHPIDAAFGGTVPTAWPVAASCQELARDLVAMDEVSARHLNPALSPLGLASLAPGAVAVTADLPVPDIAIAGLGGFECGLIIGAPVALPVGPDQVGDQSTIHSTYPAGTKRRNNPEYQRLERELAASRRAVADDADILRTGDPLLDLIGTVAGGIIGGIGAASANREARSLKAALDGTPAFIEDAILAPYQYTLREVEAERRFALPVALHDRPAGLSWQTSIAVSERKRFAVAMGRHAGDAEVPRTAEATLTTPDALAAWRQAAPPLSMRMILSFVGAAGEAAPATLATTVAALRVSRHETFTALAAGPGDAPHDGVRRDTPLAGGSMPAEPLRTLEHAPDTRQPGPLPPAARKAAIAGSGGVAHVLDRDLLAVGPDGLAAFYVTREHVVAPAEALGHSSLVVVRYPDGMRAHGLVEVVDDDLGLALLYLPRPGQPLPRQGVVSPAPTGVSAPGTPWGVGGQVSGLFVNHPLTATPRWVDAVTLDRFVARLDML